MPIINESSSSRRRLAIAFFAGMALTAAVAQIPVAADPGASHQPVTPALPANPDSLKSDDGPGTTNPVKPDIYELVYTHTEEAAPLC
jgi:hypothetical protein